MGDLQIGETFKDRCFITVLATGIPATLLADVTCTIIDELGNRSAGTVAELSDGWYHCTDFTPDAAGNWSTEWSKTADPEDYVFHYPYKEFKVGGGEVTDIKAETASILAATDVATSTRAAAATALTDVTWTDARAGYMDELAAANIPTDLSTILTAIQAVQNNTRFTAAVPAYMCKPDAGNEAFRVSCNLYDEDGGMEDPDNAEVLVRVIQDAGTFLTATLYKENALANGLDNATDGVTFPAASGWRAMEKEADGKYFFFYKVANDATEETVTVEFGYTESAVASYQNRSTEIADVHGDLMQIISAVGVVDGFHDVPGQNVADNNQIRDVVGNKTDTAAGTSLVAKVVDINADIVAVDALHNVPVQNSGANDRVRDVVGNKTDTTAGDSLYGQTKNIRARTDHLLVTRAWFSPSQISVTVTAAAPNLALPSVVLPNITGTIVAVYAGFKFRMIENTNAGANKIDTTQYIQVKESVGGAYTNAIQIVDDQFGVAATTREGGDCIIGDIDVVAQVAAFNKTYNFQWTAADADLANLVFNDVQTFLIVSYY